MKHMKSLALVLGCSILFSACNSSTADKAEVKEEPVAEKPAAFDLGKAKADIEKNNAKFGELIRASDSTGLAAMYASDALLMSPGATAAKKENIVAAWGGAIKSGLADVKLTTDDLTGNADLLVETGGFEVFGTKNNLLDKGKYVVVWKPENGEWKIFRDIYNTSVSPKKSK
jgi:ketosteroid isomerase-like protein